MAIELSSNSSANDSSSSKLGKLKQEPLIHRFVHFEIEGNTVIRQSAGETAIF